MGGGQGVVSLPLCVGDAPLASVKPNHPPFVRTANRRIRAQADASPLECRAEQPRRCAVSAPDFQYPFAAVSNHLLDCISVRQHPNAGKDFALRSTFPPRTFRLP